MRYLFLVLLLCIELAAYTQQNRFVFIQAPQQQPFYVRVGDKTFSSSAFGHLVIPGLSDSVYQLFIGLPKTLVPEQEFRLSLQGSDRGLDLRTENGTQLILFDWQRAEVIKPVRIPEPRSVAIRSTGAMRSDPYSILMAGVVNDSLVLIESTIASTTKSASSPANEQTIRPNPPALHADTAVNGRDVAAVAEVPSKIADSDSSSVQVESVVVDTNPAVQDTISTQVRREEPLYRPKDTTQSQAVDLNVVTTIDQPSTPTIILLSEETGPEQKRLQYLDGSAKKADTIDVIIMKQLDTAEPSTASQTAKEDSTSTATSSIVLTNSDCSRFASDLDVDKLRVQMLKEQEDDDKVFAARKLFKTRCFTTRQVKALTELFSTQSGKYMFLDAAYPFVSDSANFKTLLELFNDPYYINRFKALVRVQ